MSVGWYLGQVNPTAGCIKANGNHSKPVERETCTDSVKWAKRGKFALPFEGLMPPGLAGMSPLVQAVCKGKDTSLSSVPSPHPGH